MAMANSKPILVLRLYVAPELCQPLAARSLQDLADTMPLTLFLAVARSVQTCETRAGQGRRSLLNLTYSFPF